MFYVPMRKMNKFNPKLCLISIGDLCYTNLILRSKFNVSNIGYKVKTLTSAQNSELVIFVQRQAEEVYSNSTLLIIQICLDALERIFQ